MTLFVAPIVSVCVSAVIVWKMSGVTREQHKLTQRSTVPKPTSKLNQELYWMVFDSNSLRESTEQDMHISPGL